MKITNLGSQLQHLQSESSHAHQLDWQSNLPTLLHYQCNQPGPGKWVHYPDQTEPNCRPQNLHGCIDITDQNVLKL